MTQFETLSILVSLLAASIAAYALIRSHRIGVQQIELQRKQAELAEFQHKLLAREQLVRMKADLRASFIRSGRNSHKFVVTNVGATPAQNVRIADLKGNTRPDPLIASQVEAVFPVAELRPHESVSVIAALHLGMELPVRLIVTWNDESGTDQQREITVQID